MSYLSLLIIPLCGFLTRMCGGGFYAEKVWKPLPELILALCFLIVGWHNYGWLAGILLGSSGYLSHNTGHGTAYTMGTHPQEALSGRKQFLSHIVDPICDWFKKPLGGNFYCWLFMCLKGAWIGASIGTLWGIPLIALYPLCYYLYYHILRIEGIDEITSGLCIGTMLYLSW